jgi:hypothetical protein
VALHSSGCRLHVAMLSNQYWKLHYSGRIQTQQVPIYSCNMHHWKLTILLCLLIQIILIIIIIISLSLSLLVHYLPYPSKQTHHRYEVPSKALRFLSRHAEKLVVPSIILSKDLLRVLPRVRMCAVAFAAKVCCLRCCCCCCCC